MILEIAVNQAYKFAIRKITTILEKKRIVRQRTLLKFEWESRTNRWKTERGKPVQCNFQLIDGGVGTATKAKRVEDEATRTGKRKR